MIPNPLPTAITAVQYAWPRLLGLIISWYLRIFWGAAVGEGLLCYGWPRHLSVRGALLLGSHVSVGRFSYVQVGPHGSLRIGDRTSFGDYVTVTCDEHIEIGADVMIAEFVSLRDYDHEYRSRSVPMRLQGFRRTPIHIGSDVWIGRSAAVLHGSSIGDGSVIGANAVVKGTISSYTVAVGVPARPVKQRASGY